MEWRIQRATVNVELGVMHLIPHEDSVRQSNDIIFECYRLMRRLSRRIEQFRDRVASWAQVSGAELYILWNVFTLGECTYSKLAEHSGVAKNTISVLVKSLVEYGYIQLRPDSKDRRVSWLRLTSLGSQVIEDTTRRVLDSEEAPRLILLRDMILGVNASTRNVLECLSEAVNYA